MRRVPRIARVLACLLSLALLAGCGGEDDNGSAARPAGSADTAFKGAIARSQAVDPGDFPAPAGRTLQQLAETLPAVNAGLATSVYLPGKNRLAFGVLDNAQKFLYGKTAVYLARSPNGRASGPFPAPADPLVVEPPFRSQGAAGGESDIAAIYEAEVELPRPGKWYVLTMTLSGGKQYGAPAEIDVVRSSKIPAVGEPAPRVSTDTRASAGGDIEAIDTRVPPSDMHDVSLSEVAGKKPVVLLFATPRLCQTRVCGPVVDIAAQLKKKYGEQAEFIHQEVYVENKVEKGLRPPLKQFSLRTEPWLFTLDAQGRVAARLEGSFGNRAFERAIKAAL